MGNVEDRLEAAASSLVTNLGGAAGKGWIALRGYLDPKKYPTNGRRIYLNVTLDTYVEFKTADVLHVQLDPVRPVPQKPEEDLYDVVATVFLKKSGTYTRITTRDIDTDQQFVRGQLLEEYLASASTGVPVWPEQAYDGGPPKSSGTGANYHCP
ncbi:MAG: hypothetical protein U0Y82_00615 [Thermoleophilia bacterium]